MKMNIDLNSHWYLYDLQVPDHSASALLSYYYHRGPVNRRFLRTKNGPAGKSETEKPAAGKREAGQSGEPGQYKT
jgi:hypothetical protein